MSYSIRRLSRNDLGAYKAIRLEALERHPEAFLSDAESFAALTDEEIEAALEKLTVFGAVLPDGRLGGINAFLRAQGAKERHRGWMIQVYVRPAHRGSGMARALCEHLIAHARAEVLQLHLGVWSENYAAIRLYEKLGFEVYGTEPRYLLVNGCFCDEHMMVRFLDKAPGEDK
ncbi:N-acetyltransferase [Devosia sp.]|uniref:GNAT family N-acetyltransferase n=1 Tax=Devosia sp. TaxID=1871048 RepID=UPI002AFDCF00|nr:N-acetyltransferase [Devosia sp.]